MQQESSVQEQTRGGDRRLLTHERRGTYRSASQRWTQLDEVNRLQPELGACEAHVVEAMLNLDCTALQSRFLIKKKTQAAVRRCRRSAGSSRSADCSVTKPTFH